MNIKNLTIGEIATVEKISGISLTQIKDKSAPKARLMIAIAYVTKRRQEPKTKLVDVEDMTMDEISAILKQSKSPEAGDPKSG